MVREEAETVELNTLAYGPPEFSEDMHMKARRCLNRAPLLAMVICLLATPWARSADLTADFFVRLPEVKREVPEPLASGHATPGFKLRGTKGWRWTPEQMLAEVPFLAQYKMNFFMNCYASLFGSGKDWADWRNEWWKPLPPDLKKGLEAVVKSCREHGVIFCFSMNPGLCSPRPLDYASDKDFEDLWQHYAWMQGLGVEWFSLAYDDIQKGIDPSGQARLVNKLFARLREKDPKVQLIFCPTHYTGVGKKPGTKQNDPYLETLAKELNKEVYVFWTGGNQGACNQHIRRADAESYKNVVKHRLIVWDNYPVNDARPTLHLGPVTGRDPDLCEVVDGYMSNPLSPQSDLNRIPLFTCADYAYNPWAYDPARSIGQAIVHLADTPDKQAVLRDLVELYPGFVIFPSARGAKIFCATSGDPALDRFKQLLALPHARNVADAYLVHVQSVLTRMQTSLPGQYESSLAVLKKDLAEMEKLYKKQYGEPRRN